MTWFKCGQAPIHLTATNLDPTYLYSFALKSNFLVAPGVCNPVRQISANLFSVTDISAMPFQLPYLGKVTHLFKRVSLGEKVLMNDHHPPKIKCINCLDAERHRAFSAWAACLIKINVYYLDALRMTTTTSKSRREAAAKRTNRGARTIEQSTQLGLRNHLHAPLVKSDSASPQFIFGLGRHLYIKT